MGEGLFGLFVQGLRLEEEVAVALSSREVKPPICLYDEFREGDIAPAFGQGKLSF